MHNVVQLHGQPPVRCILFLGFMQSARGNVQRQRRRLRRHRRRGLHLSGRSYRVMHNVVRLHGHPHLQRVLLPGFLRSACGNVQRRR